MAQTTKTEVTRTCDVCGRTVVLIQGQVTLEQLQESSGWFVIAREHLIGADQLIPITKLACTKACVRQLLNGEALELPQSNVMEFTRPN